MSSERLFTHKVVVRRPRGVIARCLVTIIPMFALASCGGSGLTENSTCQQFLAAPAQDQQSIVEQLAGKYQKPDYATPLGMPEVPYYCASHPNVTLKQFFSFA